MNIYSFMAVAIIWVVCGLLNNLIFALVGTLFILATLEDSNDNTDESDDTKFDDTLIPCVTNGPVFPDEQVADRHVHYLEEPNTVGVFTFDSKDMSWTLVGNMPYKSDQPAPAPAPAVILQK